MDLFKLYSVRSLVVLALLWGGVLMGSFEDKLPEYLTYVNQVTKTVGTQAKNELGLQCTGSGGSMPHDVEAVKLSFCSYERGDIATARRLIVQATEMLVSNINQNDKIQPFLREKPFPPGRTPIGISFYKSGGGGYGDGEIAHVYQVHGKVYYDKYDSSKDGLVDFKEESYEEAVRQVRLEPPQPSK